MINPSIVTADDHPLLLKGLNDFLIEKNYNIIDSASDGNSAYNIIIKHKPDIAILDIQMPIMSGIEVAKKCKQNDIQTKIVLITLRKEKDLFLEAKKLNVFGYVLKEFAIEEIETCLKSVSENTPYFSPTIKDVLNVTNSGNEALKILTPSERKILKLIAKDKTNRQIADMLFISSRTVEKHRSNIINKLQLEPKTNSLLIWAKENQSDLF